MSDLRQCDLVTDPTVAVGEQCLATPQASIPVWDTACSVEIYPQLILIT